MNQPRDLDPIIATWLDGGPIELPAETRRAIVVGLRTQPRTRQVAILRGWPMLPLNRLVAAAAIVLAVGGLSVFVLSNRAAGPGGGVAPPSLTPSASPAPSHSLSPAPTVTPSPTQPPVSFTSPLYSYTVSWPPGGGWDVTPATVPWPEGAGISDAYADSFRGPAGAYQDFDDVYVLAQPVPEGMTSDAWMLGYAQRMAASARDCKGPVDAWTNAVVGSLAIRRIDLVCQEIRLSDVAFVVDGTAYVISGNQEVIALFLDTFQPGA